MSKPNETKPVADIATIFALEVAYFEAVEAFHARVAELPKGCSSVVYQVETYRESCAANAASAAYYAAKNARAAALYAA